MGLMAIWLTLLGVSSDYGDSDNDVDGDDQSRHEPGGQKVSWDQGSGGVCYLCMYRVRDGLLRKSCCSFGGNRLPYWTKIHLWKGAKKFGQGYPSPLIWTKSKWTAVFPHETVPKRNRHFWCPLRLCYTAIQPFRDRAAASKKKEWFL